MKNFIIKKLGKKSKVRKKKHYYKKVGKIKTEP